MKGSKRYPDSLSDEPLGGIGDGAVLTPAMLKDLLPMHVLLGADSRIEISWLNLAEDGAFGC